MATLAEALAVALEHHQAGRLDVAEEIYRRILAVEPDHADALHLLGCVAQQTGRLSVAAETIARAIAISAEKPEYHNNLGVVFKEQGKLEEAIVCYRTALRLNPDYADAQSNLANVLRRLGKHDEAAEYLRRAIELDPRAPRPLNNLGNVLHDQGMLDEAAECYRQALELNPNLAEAYVNLGGVCKDQGQLADATRCYQRALELRPDSAEAHSNLIFTLHLRPEFDAQAIGEEVDRFRRQHAEPLRAAIRPHTNDRSPDRRLRVGYVSPDLRWHAVGQFLLPLLESHDHREFEIFCYASVQTPDAVTDRCRACADVWRDVSRRTDEQLAGAVADDRIDLLVDLSLHTAGNRLLVFARKPAPVQVTYLAYCGTSGLRTIDYRLTDPYFDPPGCDEDGCTESPIRLPETYWCYRPLVEAPPVNEPPSRADGKVTFGSLNNFCKVNSLTLATWSRLLDAVRDSRLLLHARPGSHRDRLLAALLRQGISPTRLSFVDGMPTAEYFRAYHSIDIALDPFPYGGGLTTCDALWMGVPVVSLAGGRAVGRGGLSILSNVGLEDLVARDADQYVEIAVQLAKDPPRLANLRATLRERMRNSPLMDAPRFARNVENAYRTMWHRWCAEV